LLKQALQCLPYLPLFTKNDRSFQKDELVGIGGEFFFISIAVGITFIASGAVFVVDGAGTVAAIANTAMIFTIAGTIAAAVVSDIGFVYRSCFYLFIGFVSSIQITLAHSGFVTTEILLTNPFLVLSWFLLCFLNIILLLGSSLLRGNYSWIDLHIWLITSQAAHLDRTALVSLIGEKALCLLVSEQEKRANREP
jgi:hypothetical protein